MTCKPIVLSEKQEKWFAEHFKHTKNAEIAERLGISFRSVVRLARKRGLEKTKQFVRKCQIEAMSKAVEANRKNRTYPPKGYHIPGREKGQFKPGVTPLQRLGKKREHARIEKAKVSMARTRKKEHARIIFGLPQKTNLRLVRQSRAHVCTRYNLKKKGYLIDDDKRIAYYDEETDRSPIMEKFNKWYRYEPLN